MPIWDACSTLYTVDTVRKILPTLGRMDSFQLPRKLTYITLNCQQKIILYMAS